MKHISVTDVTLRKFTDSASAESDVLGFRDKTETAKLLDRLFVDAIELAPISGRSDVLFCHTIAPLMQNSVLACHTDYTPESAENAVRAFASAEAFRLISSFPASVVQMEYMCRKKPDAMLELIGEITARNAALCGNTEAVFADATRAEREFLYESIRKAVNGGAKYITVCDDAGCMLPDEVSEFIKDVIENTASSSDLVYQFECADKLGLGSALALAAVKGGANGVKTSFAENGILLSPFVKLLRDAGDRLGIECGVDQTACDRVSEKIGSILHETRAENSPFSGGVRSLDDEETLSGADSARTVENAVKKLGYELSEEDNARVYEEFGKVAAKKSIHLHELDAIVASVALQAPSAYKLKSFVINNGNVIGATAHIELCKDDTVLSGISVGDGPIDAAFLAIEQIIGHHFELDDFQIQALTEGRGAVGSSIVKLRAESGKLYSGKGVSTDIIGAAIKAYINALNKIAYNE